MTTRALPLIAALLLTGCAAAGGPSRAPQSAGARPAADLHRGGAANTGRGGVDGTVRGGEGVIGRDAAALTRMFGPPRLDVHDGAGHKLQFTGTTCVLDTYLYAPRDGAEPVVTHIDARAFDGSDVDRATCITALQRRGR